MNIRVRAILDFGGNERCHRCLTPQFFDGKWRLSFNTEDLPDNFTSGLKGEVEVIMPKDCRLMGLPIKWVTEE